MREVTVREIVSGLAFMSALGMGLVACKAEFTPSGRATNHSAVPPESAPPLPEFGASVPSDEDTEASKSVSKIDCASRVTLRALVECIDVHAPPREWFERTAEKFVVPSADERRAWGEVVERLLRLHSSEGCTGVDLPGELARYDLFEFRVADARPVCVLMEVVDENADGKVDRGWGTLIVNLDAKRELSIQVPHSKCDQGTRRQGIDVFEQTEARTFLMAGSHRHASLNCSRDQPLQCAAGEKIVPPPSGPVMTRYSETDAAHNVGLFFQVTTERLAAHYAGTTAEGATSDFTAIQFHAKGASTCRALDVFMSHGVVGPHGAPVAAHRITRLRERLLAHNPDWAVGVPGLDACSLGGTENIQGRHLNGVSATQVANVAATVASGSFVHIEQKRGEFRDGSRWVRAITETWRARGASE